MGEIKGLTETMNGGCCEGRFGVGRKFALTRRAKKGLTVVKGAKHTF